MASNLRQGNFGDSDQNHAGAEGKVSQHVFDGAGENVHYHSDSESVGSRASRTRYVNPAIYVETVESSHSVTSLQTDSLVNVVTPHPHSTYRSNSTPILSGRASTTSSSSVKRKSCKLDVNSPKTGKSDEEVEDETPRLDQTYREHETFAMDTFRLSVASLSTTTTDKEARDQNETKKQAAFEQWLARKEQEKRNRARNNKCKVQPAPAISEEKREESYRRWLEAKRIQDKRRRAEDLLRQYRQNEDIERQRQDKEEAKESKLADWIRKKKEKKKGGTISPTTASPDSDDEVSTPPLPVTSEMKTREERKVARTEVENQRRRSLGERAYQDWLRTSKNKPLPVPLNQGVLSMRGSVSQMYINPVPWKSLI